MKHDTNVHKRFLDYRERHVYFGRNMRMLDYAEFAKLDEEHRALEKMGDDRDDDDEARLRVLTIALLMD